MEIIIRRRAEVETTHDGVDFLHAGDFLRLSDRIDDADMTAGADHDQTAILHIEASRVLVDMLVGHDLALQLGSGEMAHVAAEAVLHGELDHGVWQDLLDAAAFDLAGRKCLFLDHRRRLGENQLDPMGGDCAAIKHAAISERARRRACVPLAEIVLAAAIEREFRRQRVAFFIEEADEAAPMIVVTVAEDEGADLARIYSLQVHIGHQRFRRVAEIEQDRASIGAALRIQQQRQTPLGMKRTAEIGRTSDFYRNPVYLLRARKTVESAVDEHAHGKLVDSRHFDCRGGSNLDAYKAAGCCGSGENCRRFQEVSTF